MEVTLDNGGGSWNELAKIAGIDPPLLKPGEEAIDIQYNLQLYWPNIPEEMQELRK